MIHTTSLTADMPAAIVDQAALAAALDIINNAVENRCTIPILANAALTADAGDLVVTGTDLDLAISVRIPGDVDGRMATTVPAQLLQKVVKAADKGERIAITMLPDKSVKGANDFKSDTARVAYNGTRFNLNSLPIADFPEMQKAKGRSVRFDVPGSTFWNALDSTKGAISTEESRYYLNGVYLHVADRLVDPGMYKLRAVATDGHRLYSQDLDLPAGADTMPAVIIPRKTVLVLHKLLKGKTCPATVRLTVAEDRIDIAFGNVTVMSKLVDGVFPDYPRIVPTGNDKRAAFDARDTTKAIAKVTLIASERGRAVKLSLEDESCTLTVTNPDSGSASSTLPCDWDSGPLEIGFNAAYLTDMIANACPAGGEFRMTLADAGGPAMIRGTLAGWFGVLMPMRV